jgi:hypothetical protein
VAIRSVAPSSLPGSAKKRKKTDGKRSVGTTYAGWRASSRVIALA